MTDTRRLAAAIAGALLAPLALSGCASASDLRENVPAAVIATDPNVEDVTLWVSTGLEGLDFTMRIFVRDVSPEAVAASIETSLEAAFHAAPSEPLSIAINVGVAPRPADVDFFGGKLSLDDVAPLVDVPGYLNGDSLRVRSDQLAERFGPWGSRD